MSQPGPRLGASALLAWAGLVAYCGLIFFLSSQPLHVPSPFRFSDKLYHLIEYAVLGALAAKAFCTSGRKITWRSLVWSAWIFATLYGMSDEFHQSFVPARDASWADVASDSLGAWMGARLTAGFLDGVHKRRYVSE